MDLPWGDEKTVQFITNVGLITTEGPLGKNIMAAEMTHLISYKPGMVAICIGPGKATKEFGISLASTDQSIISSISGMNSGKTIDKMKALEELGFKFKKASKIKALMVEGSVLGLECKLHKELIFGDHIMFIGEVIEASLTKDKNPLAYYKGIYSSLTPLEKPTEQKREQIKKIVEKHKK